MPTTASADGYIGVPPKQISSESSVPTKSTNDIKSPAQVDSKATPAEQAQKLLASQNYKEAENAFDRAIALNSNDSNLYLNRGEARKQQGNFDGALQDYNSAVKLDPKSSRNYRARSELYLEMSKPTQALKDINSAIAIDPSDVYNHNLKGHIQGYSCNYQDSIAAFSTSIKLAPSSSTYAARATSYMLLKDGKNAKKDLDKAIALGIKTDAAANYSVGTYYRAQRKWQKALSYATKAVELNPRHWAYHSLCYDCYAHLWEDDRALEHLNKAIELNPKNWGLYCERAILFGKLDKSKEQLDSFSSAIALAPTHTGLYEARSEVFRKLGRLEDTIKDCDLAIKYGSVFPSRVFRTKGAVLAQLGRLKEAEAALNISVQKAPDRYTSPFATRAMVYEKQGQFEKAIADYTTCIKINKADFRALRGRADLYDKLGKHDLAKADRAGLGKDCADILQGLQDSTTSFGSIIDKTEHVNEARQVAKEGALQKAKEDADAKASRKD